MTQSSLINYTSLQALMARVGPISGRKTKKKNNLLNDKNR
jgi:hypothetical protein